MDLKLFVAPNTCARVPTIALEEIGVPFETELVRTAIKQQKTPEFLAINPKGKVPALIADGIVLTENVAINSWLHSMFPDANLLPESDDEMERSQQIADLAFFAGTVHPIVTRIAMPMFFTDEGDPFVTIRPKGTAAMMPVMQLIEDRLSTQNWWYGAQWSIIDAYLFWVWTRITGVGFDKAPFPNITAHEARMMERPSVQRAMEREVLNIEVLKAEGNFKAPR